jgi:hypothetical protein
MHAHRLIALFGVIAVGFGASPSRAADSALEIEREQNAWPGVVRTHDTGSGDPQWSAAGPLLFGRLREEGGTVGGFRPVWVQMKDAEGRWREGYFLYPLFSYRTDAHTYQWSFFELIRGTGVRADAPAGLSQFEQTRRFEIWPFWFSRQAVDPDESYRALFPVAGTIKNRLGFERASWLIVPLYTQTEKRGVVTTAVPWPFVRVTRGAAHGFGVWPLFEHKTRPGGWDQQTYLWPLGYNNTIQLPEDSPAGPGVRREIGVLPLYARHTAPGYIDENYLWPFFGYTDRVRPVRYHETRYLWPFLVQGRGDEHVVNRWSPFYTHSIEKGYDKTWYLWPVVRQAHWNDRGLTIAQTRVLFFLYWSEVQRSATRATQPATSLTHLWPLYSHWTNGAGREQFQLFSPLDVFFSANERIRAAWSPLFAIARYESTAPGISRTSLLWNAVTWRRDQPAHEREFHLGPLFSVASRAEDRRIAIGNGLLSFRREGVSSWKIRWLDFPTKAATAANQPR